jgi:SAM-dependent methyltransferase
MNIKLYNLNDFKKIEGGLNLFYSPAESLFGYSDGYDVESRIYRIISKAQDISCFSSELNREIFDWASEYHLSPVRHNLLRHIEFKPNDSILELGCGCGAITRQLGESGASITAIDGSISRVKCAASRCRDLSNVRFYCANMWDIEFSDKYDYITLIGVLEYSPLYIHSENPVQDCLKLVKSLLKDTGTLIIAIENQLGLKYFCGHEEDHVGIPFFGIEGRYNNETPVTFGKQEITNILKESGYRAVDFHYPFPDYKCPQFVFTEMAFNTPYFAPEQIIQQVESNSYSRTTKAAFKEELTWEVLGKNNMLSPFSNSFLIFANISDTNRVIEKDFLAVGYSLNRSNKYKTRTEFKLHNDPTVHNDPIIKVYKSKILKDTPSSKSTYDNVLKHDISEQDYHYGENLEVRILKSLAKSDFDDFVQSLKIWIKFLMDYGISEINQDDIYDSLMFPDFIDCIPSNLIIQSNKIIFFDREWIFYKPFSLRDVILRYLYDTCMEEKYYVLINSFVIGDVKPMLKLINYLGIDLDETSFQNFLLTRDFFYSSNQDSYCLTHGVLSLEDSLPKNVFEKF